MLINEVIKELMVNGEEPIMMISST